MYVVRCYSELLFYVVVFCFNSYGKVDFFTIFFFNDTATTEIYTLSLHDALPIWLLTQIKRYLCRLLPLYIILLVLQPSKESIIVYMADS